MEYWKEISIAIIVTLALTAALTYMARESLIQAFGKHLYDVEYGRKVSVQHYMLDEQARRRVRYSTVIAFVIILACTGACVWNFMAKLIITP